MPLPLLKKSHCCPFAPSAPGPTLATPGSELFWACSCLDTHDFWIRPLTSFTHQPVLQWKWFSFSLAALEAHKSYRCFQINLRAWHPYPLPVPSSLLFIQRVLDKLVYGQNGLFKTRDVTLLTKVYLVRAMVFPVVMYGCESWTIKFRAKEFMLLNCDVGELLRVPWTARRSNQSILKESVLDIHWKD